jgi:replication-associated recombination protein RarA
MNQDPESYVPTAPDDFIGESRRIALMLETKARALVERKNPSPVSLLLYGQPGCGKTRLAEMFASLLAWHPTAIESVNDRNAAIDVIWRWQDSSQYISIGGRFVSGIHRLVIPQENNANVSILVTPTGSVRLVSFEHRENAP